MRIVIFNPFKYIQLRGIPKYTSELAEALVNDGHQVIEVTWPVRMAHCPRFIIAPLFICHQQLVFPFYGMFLRPDLVIESYNSYSIIIALMFHVVCVYHDFVPFFSPRWFLKPSALYQRLLHKIIFLMPKIQIFCVSPRIVNEVKKFIKYNGKINILPNAIKPLGSVPGEFDGSGELISECEHFKSLGFIILTTISGEGSNKNISGLIDALRALELNVFLIAFGFSEASKNELKYTGVNESILIVKVVGPVTGLTMSRVIRFGDLFIFHSLSEGFGRPVAEALLEGNIVITDDIPAVQMLSAGALKNVIVCNVTTDLLPSMNLALKSKFEPFDELLEVPLKQVIHIVEEIL